MIVCKMYGTAKRKKLNAMLNEQWYGQSLQTDGTPMVDDGTGRALILRTFEFAFNPLVIKQLKEKKVSVTKQDLFNYHWPHIKSLIWSDGLIANTDVDPRVVLGKKRYRIFVLCEPKTNKNGIKETVIDRATDLQTIFKQRLTISSVAGRM